MADDTQKPEDTRTPFQKWLGGIGQSMEAQRLAEQQRVQMATGGDGGLGTSPLARAYGFFTDTPQEAAERAARVAQFQGADWQGIRAQNEAALTAASPFASAPAPAAAPLPTLQSNLVSTAPVTRQASATPVSDYRSSLAQRAQAVEGLGKMRQQRAANDVFQRDLLLAFANMPRGQFNEYLKAQPAPGRAPSSVDKLITELMGLAQSNAQALRASGAPEEQVLSQYNTNLMAILSKNGLLPTMLGAAPPEE